MLDVGGFGFFRAQKFSPRWQVEEQLAHLYRGSGCAARSLDFHNFAAVDDDLRAFDGFRFEFRVDAVGIVLNRLKAGLRTARASSA